MPRYKWAPPHIPDVTKLVTRPPISPKTGEVLQRGRQIYIWKHTRTNQILFSFDPELKDSHLKQLPFIGKKTVPPSIRPDLWKPYCTVSFPSREQGLFTYRRMSEWLRLHYVGWEHTEQFKAIEREKREHYTKLHAELEQAAEKRQKKRALRSPTKVGEPEEAEVVEGASAVEDVEDDHVVLKAEDVGEAEETEMQSRAQETQSLDQPVLEPARMLPAMAHKKWRMQILMNQSENVLADLSDALHKQIERSSEMETAIVFRKLQQAHSLEKKLEEINAMAKQVSEGAIERLEKEIADVKIQLAQETDEEAKKKLNESIGRRRRRIKKLLWAERQATAYRESQAIMDKIVDIDERVSRLKEEEADLLARDQQYEAKKVETQKLVEDINTAISIKTQHYRSEMRKYRIEYEYTRDLAEASAELQQLSQDMDRLEKLREIEQMNLWRLTSLSEHPTSTQNLLKQLAVPQESRSLVAFEKLKAKLEAQKREFVAGRQRLLELLDLERRLPEGELLDEGLKEELLDLQTRKLDPSLWRRDLRWRIITERRQQLLDKRRALPPGKNLPYLEGKELQLLMSKTDDFAEWDANLERLLLTLYESEAPPRIQVNLELAKVQAQLWKLKNERKKLLPAEKAEEQFHPSLLHPVARALVSKELLTPLPKPYSLQGVSIEWTDAADMRLANWPAEVQHAHLGVSKRSRRIIARDVDGMVPEFPRTEEELMDSLMARAPNVVEEYSMPPEPEEVVEAEQQQPPSPPPPPPQTGIWKYLPTFQNRFSRGSAATV